MHARTKRACAQTDEVLLDCGYGGHEKGASMRTRLVRLDVKPGPPWPINADRGIDSQLSHRHRRHGRPRAMDVDRLTSDCRRVDPAWAWADQQQ